MAMIKQVRVSLIEGDPHFRLYLEGQVSASPRHRLLRSAAGVEGVARWPLRPDPHVVLVEIDGPGSEQMLVLKDLVARFPAALPIVLTARDDPATILEAIRAGAVGYVLKQSGREAIFDAIDNALAGGSPLSPRVAREVLGLLRLAAAGSAAPFRAVESLPVLTARETEILAFVAQGRSDKLIGEQLGLARSTVKNAMVTLFGKLQVRTRTEAAVKYTRYAASIPTAV